MKEKKKEEKKKDTFIYVKLRLDLRNESYLFIVL